VQHAKRRPRGPSLSSAPAEEPAKEEDVKASRILSLALVAVSICTAPLIAHSVLRDIEYANVDGHSLRLDLYLPERVEAPVPLVLWVHGGGWRAGDKSPTYAPETLGEGYAVASVNYRLSDVAQFPAQIHDVKAAVRFLRGNAHRFGLDPNRFGAWGSSAGGHLVALLGTSCGILELEGELGDDLDQSSCVQAVCDFFGPTDLVSLLAQRGASTRRPMPEDHLIGGPVEEHVDLATLASPIAHVDETDPPFLIMHGSEDATVPVDQSIAFDETLRAAGVESTLVVIDSAGHGFPRSEVDPVKPFFDRHLAPAAAVDGSGVAAFHRAGQTFLTWPETTAARYAIYRGSERIESISDLAYTERIAIIEAGSSLNARAANVEGRSPHYAIEEGADPVPEGVGLYVGTAKADGAAAYAVVALFNADESSIWLGGTPVLQETVGPPVPVLQSRRIEQDHARMHFVHWAPHGGADDPIALCNRPGQAFNFIVREPLRRTNPTAAVFVLHGGSGSYASRTTFPDQPDLVIVSPDSFMPGDPEGVDRSWDAWYGYHENVGTGLTFSDGRNVAYTERRLRFMVEWFTDVFSYVDPARIFLRGSSMGGVGTVFSAIALRDLFAAGLAVVPRFDYGADDVPPASFETFATRWGTLAENLPTDEGIGVYDRLGAGFLARTHSDWDFAPVWIFNGRNDEAVGWSEKIPFYETMNESCHGWAFFWDERAHGGQSPYPRAWRENGTEDEAFHWMVRNVRLDQSYAAFSGCSIDDAPRGGDPSDGTPVGTINGYLRWDPSAIEDEERRWSIGLYMTEDAPPTSCTVDVTARRTLSFDPNPGILLEYEVWSHGDARLLESGLTQVDEYGLVTIPNVPVDADGVRLTVVTLSP